MSKLNSEDFYYGAVLSKLLNKHFRPALVEGDDDSQVYDLYADKFDTRLYIKYRKKIQKGKKKDYSSWQFNFTEKELRSIENYFQNCKNLSLALVCITEPLYKSELAVLNKKDIQEVLTLTHGSFTISRAKNEKYFRISVGGGREKALLIKASAFEDTF